MTLEASVAQNHNANFLAQNGYPLPGGEDFEVINHGNHVVYQTGVHVPGKVDREMVWEMLCRYWDHQNTVLAAFFRFHPYQVTCYDCNHCGGTHLYISIYQ